MFRMNQTKLSSANDPQTLKENIILLQNCIHELEKKHQEEIQTKVAEIQNKQEEIKNKENEIKEKNEQISTLYDQLKLAVHQRFGKRSEKLNIDDRQANLFDEPEVSKAEQEKVEEADVSLTIPTHTRKKPGRKPLPADLPREEIIHDLSADQKQCGHCGHELHKIGEDISEQLDYIPAKLKVIRHIRYKYACRSCEGNVKSALLPKQPIAKSIATPRLLTQIIISKYQDHLPLYRQEAILKRLGIDLHRGTTSVWMIKVGQLMEPLYKRMQKQLIGSDYLHADETPVQVLRSNGKRKPSKSYMFVYCTGARSSPLILYDYQSSRSGKSAKDYLEKFKGYLQTDAFSGYNIFNENKEVKQLGCWVHVRRKFFDIVKIAQTKGLAHEAVERIAQLYQIETEADEANFSHDERKALRLKKSEPLLESFKVWLDENYVQTPPKGLLGKAMGYALNNWELLIRYLEDGKLKLDNNAVENAIRPFALGRKNWMFCGNEKGAKASAIIYSMIETSKANQIAPEKYLQYLLEKLPACKIDADYEALLPEKYQSMHCSNLSETTTSSVE